MKKEKLIWGKIEVKLSLVFGVLIIALRSFRPFHIDHFTDLSMTFQLFLTILVIIFSILFFRTVTVAFFDGNQYRYSYIPLLILCVSLAIFFAVPFSSITLKHDFNKNKTNRELVVNALLDNKIKTNAYGIALLPDSISYLSCDGYVRYCNDGGSITVVFLTFKLKTTGIAISYIQAANSNLTTEYLVNRKGHFPYYPVKSQHLSESWYLVSSNQSIMERLYL